VIGGSGYFDGTGDYLTAPDDAAWDLGSNNFTIESWVYPTASPAQPIIIGQWTSSYSWIMTISNDSNRYLRALLYNGSFNDYVSSTSLQLNAWNHCAFVRESNTVSLYLNGARVFTTTFTGSVSNSTAAVSVGADTSGGQPLQGYITNSRVVNGTALYSGTTYTVPTAPLSAVTNTKLLLNMTNAAIFDNAMMNDLETVGNAQISTSVKKYGTGSLSFDGTGDWLTSAFDALSFGTGDYTIECWVYPVGNSANTYTAYVGGNFDNELRIVFGTRNSDNTLTIEQFGVGRIATSSAAIAKNTWTYVAVTRASGSYRLFINGVIDGTGTNSAAIGTGGCVVGAAAHGNSAVITSALNGYIDDLRITKGFARYTATFTPPTSALSDTGPY
jgi:hypothetical protein